MARALRNAVTRGFGEWVTVELLSNGKVVYSHTHLSRDAAQEMTWDWLVEGRKPFWVRETI